MSLFSRKSPYSSKQGSVRYLDGSGLRRSMKLGAPQFAFMALLIALGLGLSVYTFVTTSNNMAEAAARSQASVEENLSRESIYNVPHLQNLIAMDNTQILQQFADSGFTTYDLGGADGESPDGSMCLMKIPDDMTLTDASVMMMGGGIGSLNASQAALLLNGSWVFDVQRGEGTEMRVRYADFSVDTIDAAIEWAVDYEGFNGENAEENDYGVDNAGNTFRAGTIDIDGTTYEWQVSAISLKSVYNISGLPENSIYVGIRLSTI
ncbi:teichoic acid transporter [Xiamenia xianingshaonis]|uniref:Teichoic acid transporter n=1 Tax=Xiamenia xianingshaonis TaxID=2682776 RepID=A0A9E6SV31_9ACTN|nr:teichoic acid transporter [Xiamenia xianingshaonis]NGM17067.1 teichoic acid transporter [Eggerthellaceae bacterium zg-893]NHM13751.1 teichoic acid transporter [Xiamenia xianingshaonis]NHM16965.1 teichoic acid transporter [Xiamenia xianingshaonis]QTU85118.1 teichoic acid transporter [Xiamenia xianingshaonis]